MGPDLWFFGLIGYTGLIITHTLPNVHRTLFLKSFYKGSILLYSNFKNKIKNYHMKSSSHPTSPFTLLPPTPSPEIPTLISCVHILPEFLYVYISRHEYYFHFPLSSYKIDTVYTVLILLNNICCGSPHVRCREQLFGS